MAVESLARLLLQAVLYLCHPFHGLRLFLMDACPVPTHGTGLFPSCQQRFNLCTFFKIDGEPGSISFAHLRDGCADKPTAAAAAPAPFPMNDRNYRRNRTSGQIHSDKE